MQIANRDAEGEKIVTVSIGVATLLASKKQHYADLLRMADQALYRAKESGRNSSKDNSFSV
jgi:diguanylate cyclase (GGDEF)-like protein